MVVVEKEYKNSPDDMETITMWAEMSDKATNARQNTAPDTHVQNAILDIDAAKIRKDAENARRNDEKLREQKVSRDAVEARDKEYLEAVKHGDNGNVIPLSERFNESKSDIRFFRISDGHAYGFTVGGKIYIDQRIATADTPIHEYAHLWASAMRKLNPKEWENIVELMKGTPIWEEVKRNYPELTNDDDIADEVLAFYSGSRGVERLREEQKRITDRNGKEAAVNAINRVKEALKRFWKNVAEWFNVHFTTAEEVADKVLSDLLNGVNPTLAGVENDIRFAENSEEAEIVARAKADGTYMKAPNGKQSNLSPRQWVQVRTKAFKDWFGDWELSAKVLKIISGIKEHGFNSFEDAKAWAKENIVRTLTNEETGGKGEIRISNNAISKFLSESAVAKSDNKDVHLSVLRVLPDVIRESVDAEQHPDYKKGEDGNRSAENGINENVTIHRLYGAVDIDGKLYRVKVTLKEYTDSNRPRKAYSYEATKIELLAGTLVGGKPSNPNTNNSISAAKLLENVESSKEKGKKLLDCSKIVDENGEPLVVYHGTQSEFSSFDKDAILERKDGIKGFYFVPEKRRGSVAGYYANDKGKIMPIEMSSTRLEEKSKQENHPFEISELKNLVRELQSPIAVFKYGNNAKNVIIAIEYQGKQFLVGIHFNQSRRNLIVNDIRGIFPKTKTKGLNWLSSASYTYQQEIDKKDLDLLANIVKDFENPSVDEENSNREVTEAEHRRMDFTPSL